MEETEIIEEPKFNSSIIRETEDTNTLFQIIKNYKLDFNHYGQNMIKVEDSFFLFSGAWVIIVSKGDNNSILLSKEQYTLDFFTKYFGYGTENYAKEILWINCNNEIGLADIYESPETTLMLTIGNLTISNHNPFNDILTFSPLRLHDYVGENGGVRDINNLLSFSHFENCWKRAEKATYNLEAHFDKIKEIEELNNITVDVDRINMLAEEVLKFHAEEDVDIRVCEKRKTVELVIRYPELTISNENGENATVENLIVSLPMNLNITGMDALHGTRSTYTYDDVISFTRECCDDTCCSGCEEDEDGYEPSTIINNVELYSHSHLSGEDYSVFTPFCLGDTPISFMFKQWSTTSMEFPYQIILRLIDSYVQHESVEGGPYICLNNRGSVGEEYIYSSLRNSIIDSVFNVLQAKSGVPLKYVNKELRVDRAELKERLDALAKQELLHTNSYGRKVNGQVIPRLRTSENDSSANDVLEYLEGAENSIYFKENCIRKTYSSAITIIQDPSTFEIFTDVLDYLIVQIETILTNDKFKKYANNWEEN